MPIHQTFFAPQCVLYENIDTGERWLEIDFAASMCKGIEAYKREPGRAMRNAAWLDQALTVEGAFWPTKTKGVIRLIAGDVPVEDDV